MINLYRPCEGRPKTKTMFPTNKSHIASMHIRVNCDGPPELPRNRPDLDANPRSAHKYKKSLLLQDTTIQLVKRASELYPKVKESGLSTERLKDPFRKRSIDCSTNRIRTDLDEQRGRPEATTVEIGVEELRELVGKLRCLKS
jgi:hypothetical protein